MARNVHLRKLLESKLGIKQAQLYKYAEKVAAALSIKTSDAILVLAAKNLINLKKYGGGLSDEKLAEVRSLLPYLPAPIESQNNDAPRKKSAKPKAKKAFRVALENPAADPILSKGTHTEMEAMVSVYKTLYHLENSIRQFISRVLKAKYGTDWWNKKAPKGLKETVVNRTADDQINAWHQKRSNNPIDYIDLNQLPPLIRATQTDFIPAFFPSAEWFQHFIDEVYRSRCVVCHMNPLIQVNVDAVGVRFNQWEQLVKAKISDVEKVEASAGSSP